MLRFGASLVLEAWDLEIRGLFGRQIALAPHAPLASINARFPMAFVTREIESPDPVTRVAAADARARDNLGDIGEKMVLNMGPSHPATHGVLRLVLELDGETITKATPDIGFLHRVDEKIRDLPETFVPQLEKFLDEFIPRLDEVDKLLTRNRIFVDRTRDVGVIPRDRAIAYALSGPNLRGSGVEHDLRRKHPYLDYEKYDFDVVVGSAGDCYDRYLVRVEEMRQSVRILRQVIEKLPAGPINVVDWENKLPPKTPGMTKMEELIHPFILVTGGLDAAPGANQFGGR